MYLDGASCLFRCSLVSIYNKDESCSMVSIYNKDEASCLFTPKMDEACLFTIKMDGVSSCLFTVEMKLRRVYLQ